jgi:HSP20 family molecular chaperone IbpA
MTRLPLLSSPLLLGFEEIERLVDRIGKSGGEGYPPYNIERIGPAGSPAGGQGTGHNSGGETLRITLAVAGFTREQLDITVEDKQLMVRGKQEDDKAREYLHRGIAARQFSRTFVLADGIEVKSADLADGLLAIDLVRHEPDRVVRRVEISRPRKP